MADDPQSRMTPLSDAYLKWMSAVDANGFPANFGTIQTTTGGGRLPPGAHREQPYFERT